MGALLDKPITDKRSRSGYNRTNTNIRYATSSMQGWLPEMEDENLVITSLPELPSIAIFGVFDGHYGSFAAQYIKENFHSVFVSQQEFKYYCDLPCQSLRDHRVGLDILKSALKNTFIELDREMRISPQRMNATPDFSYELAKEMRLKGFPEIDDQENNSGSTCLIVVVTPRHIICANAGDSRSCICTSGLTINLSYDHKPHKKSEIERIESAGGYVGMNRVDGELTVSRTIGDYRFKAEYALPPEKQKISCVPDITVRQRSSLDEFILLASDGVWDALSCAECTSLIREIVVEGEHNLSLVCEEVLDKCLEKDSKDNMSIVLVALPTMKFANKRGPGVVSRRMVRAQSSRVLTENVQTHHKTPLKLLQEADSVTEKFSIRLRDELRREKSESLFFKRSYRPNNNMDTFMRDTSDPSMSSGCRSYTELQGREKSYSFNTMNALNERPLRLYKPPPLTLKNRMALGA